MTSATVGRHSPAWCINKDLALIHAGRLLGGRTMNAATSTMAIRNNNHVEPASPCFIAAPEGSMVGALIALLKERHIEAILLSELSPERGALLNRLADAIERAD